LDEIGAEDPRYVGARNAVRFDFEAMRFFSGVVDGVEVCRITYDCGRLSAQKTACRQQHSQAQYRKEPRLAFAPGSLNSIHSFYLLPIEAR
jgi:hypothetical protein